jgi:pyridoxamine 5'-phosphate oxidase
MNLADLRRDYALKTLDESQVDRDPLRQFEGWMQEALEAQLPEPTAMHLATVGADGRPSGRIVLLKGVDAAGFVFFTNYESRKGRELAGNPGAALTFLWKELERQVRIEGIVGKVDGAESDAYFASRPMPSRIGAWASPQSQPIDGRAWLVASIARAALAHGHAPTRPPHWGGYRLVPDRLEFWQGRQSRLHDRVQYARESDGWRIRRLAP